MGVDDCLDGAEGIVMYAQKLTNQVWVLTGDKMETAINIGSVHLFICNKQSKQSKTTTPMHARHAT